MERRLLPRQCMHDAPVGDTGDDGFGLVFQHSEVTFQGVLGFVVVKDEGLPDALPVVEPADGRISFADEAVRDARVEVEDGGWVVVIGDGLQHFQKPRAELLA